METDESHHSKRDLTIDTGDTDESHHSKRQLTVEIAPVQVQYSTIQRFELFLNIIAQWIIGFVTIYMSWLCLSQGLAGTALHAWLVTIGFIFLMAEGIMAHYTGNVLTYTCDRKTKTTVHWMLQLLGGACGIAGVLIKCIQKGFIFGGIHGKLGFSAFILCCVSMLTGLTALCSSRVKKCLSPVLNKTFHNILGIATFVLAWTAQYYGYTMSLFSKNVSSDFVVTTQVLTMIALVLVCIGPLKSLYFKFTIMCSN